MGRHFGGHPFVSQANERLAECLARQRLESRGALHQAWSEAADASRKAAALERRLQERSGGRGQGDLGFREIWKMFYPPPKSNIDTKNDGFLQCIFFQTCLFWVSMLVFGGV